MRLPLVHQYPLDFTAHDLALVVISSSVCFGIVVLKSRFAWLHGRSGDLAAVQAMHTQLTSRLGGMGILVALAASIFFAPDPIAVPYAKFILAILPLFLVGLAEDIGFSMSPRRRLAAIIGSSLLAIFLLGVWLPRAGIPLLDLVISHWAVGIPVTVLITTGIANGFNLIDGVNGLASFTAIVAALAISHIAGSANYPEMVCLALMLAAVLLGFFLVNFPFGLIFLGDAGAYTTGFVLSWFGIAVLVNAPDVSPWAILLTLFWPFADTVFAVFRRLRSNAGVASADRLHVHQMTMRALEICVLGKKRRHIANPLTTLVLAPFVMAPPVAGTLLWDQNLNAFWAVVVFSTCFFALVTAGPNVVRRLRRAGVSRTNVAS